MCIKSSLRKLKREIVSDRRLAQKFYRGQGEKVSVELSYGSMDELFNPALCTPEVPLAHSEFFDALDRAFESFPTRMQIDLRVRVDGCDPCRIAGYVNANLRMHVKALLREQKRDRNLCLLLLAAGCGLLVLSYLCGELFPSALLFDVINITGSLLIWSAGERFYLDRARERFLCRKYLALIEKMERAPKD